MSICCRCYVHIFFSHKEKETARNVDLFKTFQQLEIIEILNYWHTRELDDCCSTFTTQTKWWLGKKQRRQIFWVLIIRLKRLMNKREKGGMCSKVNWRTNMLKKFKSLCQAQKRGTDLIIIFSLFHFGSFIWNYNLERAIINKWHPAWILHWGLIISSLSLTSAQWCVAHWKTARTRSVEEKPCSDLNL